jgi:hypothetical protein
LFSKGQAQRTTQLLKLVDSDVCGPTQTQFKEKMTFYFLLKPLIFWKISI